MQAAQREIRAADPEIRRIAEWAASTAARLRRVPPEAAGVRRYPDGSFACEVLGAALYAALFFASSRLVDVLPF